MIRITIKSTLMTSLLVATICQGSVQAETLVWADEFDGANLNTNNWNIETGDGTQYGIPGWGNNEKEWYQSQNVTVSNGELVITAKEESSNGYPYTSGRIHTKNKVDIAYGRFEARIKLPGGKGLWPAFWMLPTNDVYGGWAASGEIDIMEAVNLGVAGPDSSKIHGTIHYGGAWPNNVYSGNSVNVDNPTTSYHVYAVEWQEGEIRWYLDGVLYGTNNNYYSSAAPYPAPFNQEFYLLLNVAVGGNWPGDPDASTVFPTTMKVDYVRIYDLGGTMPPAEPTNIAVADITPSTQGAGRGQKAGKTIVTIYDDTGAAVSGATVTATFTGDYNETVNGITDSNGLVNLVSSATAKGKVNYSICVDNVVGSLPYESTNNVETCDGL